MPRLYVTPSDLQSRPIGLALAQQISQLPSGILDEMLMAASQTVDNTCRKRIGAPQTTAVAAPGITAGSTSLPVASTLGWDNLSEQAVIIDSGSLQETILIQPGGVAPTTPLVAPYPGTLTLAAPCAFSHSAGAAAVGCYQEVDETGRSSSSDLYAEAFTQEAQIALAHAPMMARGMDFTRKVFLKQYPIIGTIINVEHAYSFDNAYVAIDPTTLAIDPAAGFYTFIIGTIILPQGLIKTTYTAGYAAVPDDIKRATELFFADSMLDFFNPSGAVEVQMGKRRQTFLTKDGKTLNQVRAEALCTRYRRRT